jgi:hypothetical protein
MKTQMKSLLLVFTLTSIVLPARSQLIPTNGLAPYGQYRKEIIKLGWIPMGNHSTKIEWPELLCGSHFCTGSFKSPGGKKELFVSVWVRAGLDKTEYYVAPQFNLRDK